MAYIACRIEAFNFRFRSSDTAFNVVYVLTRVPRRLLHHRGTPMELYSSEQFLTQYRFSKEMVQELLLMLLLEARDHNRGLPLSPMQQLLLDHRFYGAGTFQVVAGGLIKVSQLTVCRAIGNVTRLIAACLFHRLVQFPAAPQFIAMMRDFYDIVKFPGVTGWIDCTHVCELRALTAMMQKSSGTAKACSP